MISFIIIRLKVILKLDVIELDTIQFCRNCCLLQETVTNAWLEATQRNSSFNLYHICKESPKTEKRRAHLKLK